MFNIFKIPNTPSALPSETFGGAEEGEITWEKWAEQSKEKYPIRYFINEDFRLWFSVNIVRPLSEIKYWIVSNTIRKYHLLDIRHRNDEYKYGWIDSDKQILLSLFKILVNYCEKEEDVPAKIKFLKEVNDGFDWNSNIQAYETMMECYCYWKLDRVLLQKEIDNTIDEWMSVRKSNKDLAKNIHKKLLSLELAFSELEEEMLIKIIKSRQYMWT
jgi:hypothetical protein